MLCAQKPDGLCLAEDSDAIQSLNDLETLKGDWWVLKGRNCGQDDVWRGGFDWYVYHQCTQNVKFAVHYRDLLLFGSGTYLIKF